MAFGIIIIGDDILSGRRSDKHLAKIIELLGERGLSLAWAEYIGDDPQRITATLQRTLASEDIVFCCGGIGATPDDHTRQCAADAVGLPLVLHPEAKALIQQRIIEMADKDPIKADLNSAENQHRLKMGEFPAGAEIVPNAFNKIPGFSLAGIHGGRHYFVPGFPVMAEPMMVWALDTHHSHLFHAVKHLEKAVIVVDGIESALTPLMEALETEFEGVKVFSLPSVAENGRRRHIELGVKGEPSQVALAYARMLEGLDALNQQYSVE
ncbi:MAG: competence/damage-inducible protein A [Burkholderiaceae bacterium]